MRTSTLCPTSHNIPVPCLIRVTWWQPLIWLKLGWKDFKNTWFQSFAYGVLFSILGYDLVYIALDQSYLAMTLTSGFMLVAPFLALVFYDLSRQQEQHGSTTLASIQENLSSIGLFAVLLVFIISVWERITAILIGFHLSSGQVPEASMSWLFSSENLGFVIPFTVVGAALAALVFAISVVSLPMLMDRKVDIVTAIMTSLWVVRENLLAMLVWAAVIVVLTLVGIATWFVGLSIIFPVLGHASWHAYRELVQPSE